MIKKIFKNKFFKYFLSFLIPTLSIMLSFIILKITPFGDKTFFVIDMDGQYSNYFIFYRNLLLSTNNLFYSFNASLGIDTFSLFTTYLASPLNALIFLFKSNSIPIFISILLFIKIGLSGFTMNYFITDQNRKFNYFSLIFSTSYALCSYTMSYCSNIMWLDGFILLPIIALGIDYIINKNSPNIYLVSLVLAIFCNYYIGFMLCIFSVIYFVYKLLLNNDIKDFKIYKKSILTFILYSLLAGGLICFILLPTYVSITNGKANMHGINFNFNTNFNWYDIFAKLFANSTDGNQFQNYGLPNIFCGTFINLMVILYFFNKKINIKEKILSGLLLIILLASFYFSSLNVIWHGLNDPSWFWYRYSFIFSFILIILGYKSFKNINLGNKPFHILISIIIYFIIFAFVYIKQYDFTSKFGIYMSLILFNIYCILLYLYQKYNNKLLSNLNENDHKNTKNNIILITFLLMLLPLTELTVNAKYILSRYEGDSIANYENESNQYGEPIDYIKQYDDSFYRIEKTLNRSYNDGLQFGYNNLSYSSSTYSKDTYNILNNFGILNDDVWLYYNKGSTKLVDCLLGVKYLVSNSEIYKTYDNIFSSDNYSIFKNPYCLNLGYTVNNINLNIENNNTFEYQNSFIKETTNIKDSIYTKSLDAEIKTTNLNFKKTNSGDLYYKKNLNEPGYLEFNIKIDNSNLLYAYIKSTLKDKVNLYLNDNSIGTSFEDFNKDIFCLGNYNIGDTVTLKIEILSKYISISQIYFYYEDSNLLEQSYTKLNEDSLDLKEISSSHLVGKLNVNSDKEYLLLTIPYSEGWSINIDDKKVEILRAFDGLTAIQISRGEHTIELKYIPPKLILGSIISLTSLGILIVLQVYINERRKKC